jgi:hypothetical protein
LAEVAVADRGTRRRKVKPVDVVEEDFTTMVRVALEAKAETVRMVWRAGADTEVAEVEWVEMRMLATVGQELPIALRVYPRSMREVVREALKAVSRHRVVRGAAVVPEYLEPQTPAAVVVALSARAKYRVRVVRAW